MKTNGLGSLIFLLNYVLYVLLLIISIPLLGIYGAAMPTISWKAKIRVIFQILAKFNYLYSFNVNSQRERQLVDPEGKLPFSPKLITGRFYLATLNQQSLEHSVKLSLEN